MSSIKVLLVIADEKYRQEIGGIFAATSDIVVVGQVNGVSEAINLKPKNQPQVLMFDICSLHPRELNAVFQQVHSVFPNIKVIILHKSDSKNLILEAFRHGAVGHIPRGNDSPEEIISAVKVVSRGEVILDARVAGSILDEIVRKRLQESQPPIDFTGELEVGKKSRSRR
jgi:DNA-binding NarL/FixJ family response regulator